MLDYRPKLLDAAIQLVPNGYGHPIVLPTSRGTDRLRVSAPPKTCSVQLPGLRALLLTLYELVLSSCGSVGRPAPSWLSRIALPTHM